MFVFFFINKIDIFVEKIVRGRDILEFIKKYLDIFFDFDKFNLLGKFFLFFGI